jgi:hypothetical protein
MGEPGDKSAQHTDDDPTRNTSENNSPNTKTHVNCQNNNEDINTDDPYQEFQWLFPTNSQAQQDEELTDKGNDKDTPRPPTRHT